MILTDRLTAEEIADILSEPMSIHLYDAHALAAELLDAQRYRKLKTHVRWLREHDVGILDDTNIDAAVDGLPKPDAT